MQKNLNHSADSYAANTVGGRTGHLLRRCIHVLMLLIPIAYYYWGDLIYHYCNHPKFEFILIIFALVITAEILRMKKRYLIFGQRSHEATHISSFAWGAMAMAIVLLLVPNPIYAIPIVAGCAVGDPLIGALKSRIPAYLARFIAFLVIAFVWWVCGHYMPLPVWFPAVIALVTVLVEWPNLTWIDDNALMQLVPLFILLFFV